MKMDLDEMMEVLYEIYELSGCDGSMPIVINDIPLTKDSIEAIGGKIQIYVPDK